MSVEQSSDYDILRDPKKDPIEEVSKLLTNFQNSYKNDFAVSSQKNKDPEKTSSQKKNNTGPEDPPLFSKKYNEQRRKQSEKSARDDHKKQEEKKLQNEKNERKNVENAQNRNRIKPAMEELTNRLVDQLLLIREYKEPEKSQKLSAYYLKIKDVEQSFMKLSLKYPGLEIDAVAFLYMMKEGITNMNTLNTTAHIEKKERYGKRFEAHLNLYNEYVIEKGQLLEDVFITSYKLEKDQTTGRFYKTTPGASFNNTENQQFRIECEPEFMEIPEYVEAFFRQLGVTDLSDLPKQQADIATYTYEKLQKLQNFDIGDIKKFNEYIEAIKGALISKDTDAIWAHNIQAGFVRYTNDLRGKDFKAGDIQKHLQSGGTKEAKILYISALLGDGGERLSSVALDLRITSERIVRYHVDKNKANSSQATASLSQYPEKGLWHAYSNDSVIFSSVVSVLILKDPKELQKSYTFLNEPDPIITERDKKTAGFVPPHHAGDQKEMQTMPLVHDTQLQQLMYQESADQWFPKMYASLIDRAKLAKIDFQAMQNKIFADIIKADEKVKGVDFAILLGPLGGIFSDKLMKAMDPDPTKQRALERCKLYAMDRLLSLYQLILGHQLTLQPGFPTKYKRTNNEQPNYTLLHEEAMYTDKRVYEGLMIELQGKTFDQKVTIEIEKLKTLLDTKVPGLRPETKQAILNAGTLENMTSTFAAYMKDFDVIMKKSQNGVTLSAQEEDTITKAFEWMAVMGMSKDFCKIEFDKTKTMERLKIDPARMEAAQRYESFISITESSGYSKHIAAHGVMQSMLDSIFSNEAGQNGSAITSLCPKIAGEMNHDFNRQVQDQYHHSVYAKDHPFLSQFGAYGRGMSNGFIGGLGDILSSIDLLKNNLIVVDNGSKQYVNHQLIRRYLSMSNAVKMNNYKEDGLVYEFGNTIGSIILSLTLSSAVAGVGGTALSAVLREMITGALMSGPNAFSTSLLTQIRKGGLKNVSLTQARSYMAWRMAAGAGMSVINKNTWSNLGDGQSARQALKGFAVFRQQEGARKAIYKTFLSLMKSETSLEGLEEGGDEIMESFTNWIFDKITDVGYFDGIEIKDLLKTYAFSVLGMKHNKIVKQGVVAGINGIAKGVTNKNPFLNVVASDYHESLKEKKDRKFIDEEQGRKNGKKHINEKWSDFSKQFADASKGRTPEQIAKVKEAIKAAHNCPGKLFQLTIPQIKARYEILLATKLLDRDMITWLLDNGYCGREYDTPSLHENSYTTPNSEHDAYYKDLLDTLAKEKKLTFPVGIDEKTKAECVRLLCFPGLEITDINSIRIEKKGDTYHCSLGFNRSFLPNSNNNTYYKGTYALDYHPGTTTIDNIEFNAPVKNENLQTPWYFEGDFLLHSILMAKSLGIASLSTKPWSSNDPFQLPRLSVLLNRGFSIDSKIQDNISTAFMNASVVHQDLQTLQEAMRRETDLGKRFSLMFTNPVRWGSYAESHMSLFSNIVCTWNTANAPAILLNQAGVNRNYRNSRIQPPTPVAQPTNSGPMRSDAEDRDDRNIDVNGNIIPEKIERLEESVKHMEKLLGVEATGREQKRTIETFYNHLEKLVEKSKNPYDKKLLQDLKGVIESNNMKNRSLYLTEVYFNPSDRMEYGGMSLGSFGIALTLSEAHSISSLITMMTHECLHQATVGEMNTLENRLRKISQSGLATIFNNVTGGNHTYEEIMTQRLYDQIPENQRNEIVAIFNTQYNSLNGEKLTSSDMKFYSVLMNLYNDCKKLTNVPNTYKRKDEYEFFANLAFPEFRAFLQTIPLSPSKYSKNLTMRDRAKELLLVFFSKTFLRKDVSYSAEDLLRYYTKHLKKFPQSDDPNLLERHKDRMKVKVSDLQSRNNTMNPLPSTSPSSGGNPSQVRGMQSPSSDEYLYEGGNDEHYSEGPERLSFDNDAEDRGPPDDDIEDNPTTPEDYEEKIKYDIKEMFQSRNNFQDRQTFEEHLYQMVHQSLSRYISRGGIVDFSIAACICKQLYKQGGQEVNAFNGLSFSDPRLREIFKLLGAQTLEMRPGLESGEKIKEFIKISELLSKVFSFGVDDNLITIFHTRVAEFVQLTGRPIDGLLAKNICRLSHGTQLTQEAFTNLKAIWDSGVGKNNEVYIDLMRAVLHHEAYYQETMPGSLNGRDDFAKEVFDYLPSIEADLDYTRLSMITIGRNMNIYNELVAGRVPGKNRLKIPKRISQYVGNGERNPTESKLEQNFGRSLREFFREEGKRALVSTGFMKSAIEMDFFMRDVIKVDGVDCPGGVNIEVDGEINHDSPLQKMKDKRRDEYFLSKYKIKVMRVKSSDLLDTQKLKEKLKSWFHDRVKLEEQYSNKYTNICSEETRKNLSRDEKENIASFVGDCHDHKLVGEYYQELVNKCLGVHSQYLSKEDRELIMVAFVLGYHEKVSLANNAEGLLGYNTIEYSTEQMQRKYELLSTLQQRFPGIAHILDRSGLLKFGKTQDQLKEFLRRQNLITEPLQQYALNLGSNAVTGVDILKQQQEKLGNTNFYSCEQQIYATLLQKSCDNTYVVENERRERRVQTLTQQQTEQRINAIYEGIPCGSVDLGITGSIVKKTDHYEVFSSLAWGVDTKELLDENTLSITEKKSLQENIQALTTKLSKEPLFLAFPKNRPAKWRVVPTEVEGVKGYRIVLVNIHDAVSTPTSGPIHIK